MLYATDLGANLYAIDTATKQIVWDKEVAPITSITGSPLLVGDTLVTATQSGVVATYSLDGERLEKEELSTEETPIEFHGTPVMAGEDTILVSSMGGDAVVYAFNTKLEVLWKFVPGK